MSRDTIIFRQARTDSTTSSEPVDPVQCGRGELPYGRHQQRRQHMLRLRDPLATIVSFYHSCDRANLRKDDLRSLNGIPIDMFVGDCDLRFHGAVPLNTL